MRTPITDMFGIDLPILAFSHCRDVVAAVTKAGGMGVLGSVAHSPEQLEVDLAWIEAEVGDRPYGVDLIVPAKYAGSDEGGLSLDAVRDLIPAEHVAFVNDILKRYDVPELPDDAGPTAGGGPGALAAAKQLLHAVPGTPVDEAFRWTGELSARLFGTDEAREGMTAFLEKRPAAWVRPTPTQGA